MNGYRDRPIDWPRRRPGHGRRTRTHGGWAWRTSTRSGPGSGGPTSRPPSLGALRHARQAIEEAGAAFSQNIYGTAQNDADDARARFAAASEKIDEVEQALHIAMQSADDVASRL